MKLPLLVVVGCLVISCATLMRSSRKNYRGKSILQLVELVSKGDKETLTSVYKQLKADNSLYEAGDYVADTVLNISQQKFNNAELMRILYLYLLTDEEVKAPPLFYTLSEKRSKILRHISWEIAALKPSALMSKAISKRLNAEIKAGRERHLFTPQVANAVIANTVADAYTVMRGGLVHSHHESFAKAMISINPTRASDDFLDYLSYASVEDLRQQAPTSVNVYACMEILHHLKKYMVSVHHRKFEVLLWYAISRNPAFSEEASKLLESYYAQNAGYLAQLLSRLPYWAQFAYVENLGRKLTPLSRKFLIVLKQKTSGIDVIDEINQLVR